MVLCFQENHLKCWERSEDIVMPKRSALSSTTLTITDTLKMLVCPLMTSKLFLIQNDWKSYQNLQSSRNHWARKKVWSHCYWRRTILPWNCLILWAISKLRQNYNCSCLGWNFPKKGFRKYHKSFTNCLKSYEAFCRLCLLY